jgi:hypothetical protein
VNIRGLHDQRAAFVRNLHLDPGADASPIPKTLHRIVEPYPCRSTSVTLNQCLENTCLMQSATYNGIYGGQGQLYLDLCDSTATTLRTSSSAKTMNLRQRGRSVSWLSSGREASLSAPFNPWVCFLKLLCAFYACCPTSGILIGPNITSIRPGTLFSR